jgi:hypothetical protein
MNIKLIVPKVVEGYIAKFPEVTNNAYKYFNYDNRVVEERVDRKDPKRPYFGNDDFTDMDYNALVSYAQTIVNPVLMKYCTRVAYEDAMNIAIRSFANGLFDGKINANRFRVLVNALESGRQASEKKKHVVKPYILKQLGIERKNVPQKSQIRQRIRKNIPHLVQEEGKVVIKHEK